MRRYLWGMRLLVSTHSSGGVFYSKLKIPNFHFQRWGGGGYYWLIKTLNPKSLPILNFWGGGYSYQHETHSPDQIFIFRGRECSLDQLKPKVPTSLTIFIWEGGALDTTFLKYLSGGTQGISSPKFW